MNEFRLHGLVAAVHTPFTVYGELNVAAVGGQAAHLASVGVKTVFVGGSTGESHSLSLEERFALSEAWVASAPHHGIRVVVHVGSNCIRDARSLASHAAGLGAVAVSALSPMYFKPGSLDTLISCCSEIASASPELPFYFYDIPALTGVAFSMPDFLAKAPAHIPNLAGIKYTNTDMAAYLACLATGYDIPWGVDEAMLAALALGAQGAVGSSFNFAAPLYHRLIADFERGDNEAARLEQERSVRLIGALASYGYMAAAKATMGFLGVDVGVPRLPNKRLSPGGEEALRSELDAIGFFEWGTR